MKCPYCGFEESKVIDSRPTEETSAIRRRRECLKCSKRFTTYEKIESLSLVVIKKDQSRQQYNREKVLTVSIGLFSVVKIERPAQLLQGGCRFRCSSGRNL